MDSSNIPRHPPIIPTELSSRLEPGEQILNAERPPAVFLTAESAVEGLFGIPVVAYALLWIGDGGTRQSDDGSLLFSLFGLPFLILGLSLLSAPVRTYERSLRTLHIQTDRRLFICVAGEEISFRLLPVENPLRTTEEILQPLPEGYLPASGQ